MSTVENKVKFIFGLVGVLFLVVSCVDPAPAEKQSQVQVNNQQQIYANNQPVPMYDYSLPRDVMTQIYTSKNTATSTYTVFLSNSGIPIYVCPSRGYPIEGGTELTNPTQATNGYSGGSSLTTIGQADPDGLFHPATSVGTYVLCVRKNGDVVALYAEPYVMTFPYEVKIVNNQIQEVETSVSSTKINVSRVAKVLPTPTKVAQ